MTTELDKAKKQALLIGINQYPVLGPQYTLTGCINDVELMADTLQNVFGFDVAEITTLKDEQATRAGILAALGRICETVQENQVVIIHYSGHGSRIRDREGDESDGWDETIVPYDSGRDPQPNRDITDDEIYLYLYEITKTTSYVTLIFDCCHSGTMVRDTFGNRQRVVEADTRPIAQLPPSPIPPAFFPMMTRDVGPSGWLPLSQRYVLLAACRDREGAFEHQANGVDHGAFTYFLNHAFVNATSGATYRDIFERVSITITAEYPRQHPQMEGACDRALFGFNIIQPMRYVPIRERRRGEVVLGAGSAHGLTPGSQWTVHPSSAKSLSDAGGPLGLVEVSKVRAVTTDARILSEIRLGAIVAGGRAFEHKHLYHDLEFVVELEAPPAFAAEMNAVAKLVSETRLLRLARDGEEADARAYLLAPGNRAVGDPVPQLTQVTSLTWAVVGKDGLLLFPTAELSELDRLIENLQKTARYRHTLALRNINDDRLLKDKIRFGLKRKAASGQWVAAEPEANSGYVVFDEGERIAIEIVNTHDAPVYFSILDFGVAGTISLLYPPQGANEELAAGISFEVGVRQGQEILLYMPDNFPYVADPSGPIPLEAVEVFKLFASTHEADFSFLLQEGFRKHLPRNGRGTPLDNLLDLALQGKGYRDAQVVQAAAEEEWTTEERAFILRRRS